MAKLSLAFAPSDRVDWPVKIKLPQKASAARGAQTGAFKTVTVLATFLIRPDTEFDALRDELIAHNEKIRAARDAHDEEGLNAADKGFRSWRAALLRSVLVGLPEGHGLDKVFNEIDAGPVDLDEETIDALAAYRFVGQALHDGYFEMMNGGPAKN